MRQLALVVPLVLVVACAGNGPPVAHPVAAPPPPSVLDVLPRDTAVVMRIDVHAFVASPLRALVAPLLESRRPYRTTVDFLRDRCGFDPARDLRSVVAGVDAQLDEHKVVFVIDGNFDEASLVACLQTLERAVGRPPLRAKTQDRMTILEQDDGRLMVFGWVTPHTLLVSVPSVQGDASSIAGLLAQGPAAHETELARVMDRVPAHAIAWTAMVVPAVLKSKNPGMRDLESIALGVGMDERSEQLVTDLDTQLSSSELARKLATVLEQELPKVVPLLGLGAPGPKWVVGSRRAELTLHLELAVAQLPAAVRALARLDLALPSTAPPRSSAIDLTPPADVAAIPPYADVTASGLASKVLERGSGTRHPAPQDKVRVDFVGWTTDGKPFNSSAEGHAPAVFPLRGVIPGWFEGLQLMVVGEKRRLWIPVELAYDGQPGKPAGMLVFDVKLREITPGPAPLPPPANVDAAPAGATREPDGLAWMVTRPGKGASPSAGAYLTFHATTWDERGVMWKSTAQDGRPYTLTVDRTARAWQEVLPSMRAGEKRLVWAPAELTTDMQGPLRGKPLVFELELLSWVAPEPAPPDVAAPPRDATTTASGLTSKVLRPGTGSDHPRPESRVMVHYSGWTTDGKLFDSSYARGLPTRFPLRGVIPGWTEGIQLMVVGEKRRFWVPEALAYRGKPDAPRGMLVFDIELLAIDPPAAPATAP